MKNLAATIILFLFVFLFLLSSCARQPDAGGKIPVLIDSDANNELDDQHAIAYMLLNGDNFVVKGITVNRTRGGGDIEQHAKEAERIVALCDLGSRFPVYRGASGSFEEIKGSINSPTFDGYQAVDFIIQQTQKMSGEKLVLIPVGKLTNIALALLKEPAILPKVRIVWLGSNYPDPGEYNQVNDESALNFILDTDVEFEIALVRYGKPSGTDAVRVTMDEINTHVAGTGPRASRPVIGRHGGEFYTFGDYSVSLFQHAKMHGNPPSRALFDMAAVAIVKNSRWAQSREIPAPILKDGKWVERPHNERKIALWENFDRDAIVNDFYQTLNNFVKAE